MIFNRFNQHEAADIQGKVINQSQQYRDEKFHNAVPTSLGSTSQMWNTFKEYAFGNRVDPEPTHPIPLNHLSKDDFTSVNADDLHVTRLGHSTVLIQLEGQFWLTDPVFSKRASPFQWFGPKRFHEAPIALEELPELSGVLISHNHYDHLDSGTIAQIKDRVPKFLVPPGLRKILEDWGVEKEKIIELDWWDSVKIGSIELVSTPAQHFSGRSLFDRNKTLWNSWVLKGERYSVYFSGDSGYFDGFKAIGKKYGPFDIALIEVGAYHKNWHQMHMMPEESVQAHLDLKGKLMISIHNSTFDLSLHSWYDPMEQLLKLAKKRQINLAFPRIGIPLNPRNPPHVSYWWRTSTADVSKIPEIDLTRMTP